MHAPHVAHNSFNHINLMVDSFLANTDVEDLRAIVRMTLSSCPPSTATAFTAAARKRLSQTNVWPSASTVLFSTLPSGLSIPAEGLDWVLRRARTLYGAGMGFDSLSILAAIVKATVGLRWEADGDMADKLAAIDADIAQAIQSAKEEIGGGRVSDLGSVRGVAADLIAAVYASRKDTMKWSSDFPFERAFVSVQHWKL